MRLRYRDVTTPWGPFRLVARGGRLVRVILPGEDLDRVQAELRHLWDDDWDADADGELADAAAQVEEYASGMRHHFDLALEMRGTDFQQRVWQQLMDIPFGETRSYAEVAAAVGRPAAARAIGQANRRNPLPVIVPCHRVVAADGSLGGYAGCVAAEDGLKAWLLRHEAAWMR